MLHSYEVSLDCNASGDAVDYAGGTITGRVVGIKYEYGTLASTTDLDITGETSGALIFSIDNVAQANTFWWPRILPNKHTDGAAFTDAAAEPPSVFGERIKIVTDEGGNLGAGTITIYVDEDMFIAE